MGAQFGSKRQPDKARRELECPNVVPRKHRRSPESCQGAPKNPKWRLLHPFWSENVIHMAATREKSRKM